MCLLPKLTVGKSLSHDCAYNFEITDPGIHAHTHVLCKFHVAFSLREKKKNFHHEDGSIAI